MMNVFNEMRKAVRDDIGDLRKKAALEETRIVQVLPPGPTTLASFHNVKKPPVTAAEKLIQSTLLDAGCNPVNDFNDASEVRDAFERVIVLETAKRRAPFDAALFEELRKEIRELTAQLEDS